MSSPEQQRNDAGLGDERRETQRRRAARYDTAMEVSVRLTPDGVPIKGNCVEIGPNGMRLVTAVPLMEAAYVHISFRSSSNNTSCEGRVVWTHDLENKTRFESGVDIQRWGGDLPGEKAISGVTNLRPKPDRRGTRKRK